MHKNSLNTNDAIEKDGSKMNRRVAVFNAYGDGFHTDKYIMEKLGFIDPNAVRPRITELVQEGVLEECGTVKDNDGRPQRLVRKTGSPISKVVKKKSITSEMKEFLESYEFRFSFNMSEKAELLLQQIQQEKRSDLWHDYVAELKHIAEGNVEQYEQECANEFHGPF